MKTDSRDYTKALGEVLDEYVGNGQQITVAELAEIAGCSVGVIYGLQQGTYRTSFDQACAIIKHLPDEAAQRFFACLGFINLRRIDSVPGCWRRAHSAAARFGHVLARMFEDNRIDYREEMELRKKHVPALQAEISRCMGPQPRAGAQ